MHDQKSDTLKYYKNYEDNISSTDLPRTKIFSRIELVFRKNKSGLTGEQQIMYVGCITVCISYHSFVCNTIKI
jgi:hypothetical protein